MLDAPSQEKESLVTELRKELYLTTGTQGVANSDDIISV